jgi:hypothetical protein
LAFHSGRKADHSPSSNAEVKEWVELYLHSPDTPSWRGAQLGGAQRQLFLGEKTYQDTRDNCKRMSFIICTLHQILLEVSNRGR